MAAVGYSSRVTVARVTFGLFAVFLLFQASAAALGSDRGQAGLAVGAIVLAATFAVERGLFGTPASLAVKSLGLGKPYLTGVTTACAVSALLWLVLVAFVLGTGVAWTMAPGWLALVPGLFAQAGIAEETLFRGYLFRHLRQGRSFMRAALLSMLPFVAVHLILFLTMPWPIALAAVLLSVVLSFPFARLFELGGNTIWAPAVLHFVVQGTIKVVVFSGDSAALVPFVWMGASALLPQLVLLVPVRPALRNHRDAA